VNDLPEPYAQEPEIGQASRALRERLEKIWRPAPGVYGWLGTVDHKTLGKRYIVTAFAFLILGGIEALILRLQLARPEQTLLTSEQYNELFSIHGITMIFLYALPVLSGFSIFLFPLLIGARDMAFPRLNAFSYWVFLFSGLFIYASFLASAVPNNGWFNYAPYALEPYNPGLNMDFYALGMIFLGISTTTLLAVTIWAILGEFDRNRRDPVSIAAFYWHFVDVVWICVFTTIYPTPYLFHRQELFG
jgi:heme/copper-type cytochrome/quinol oxidase subunit 1